MDVAQVWFERREVGDGVSLFWEPHVHPFFRCNIWLVRGAVRDLLIDSGMGLRGLRPALGLECSRPVIAVATHAHVDHIGSLHEFEDRRGHRAEASAYDHMPDDVTVADMFRGIAEPVTALPHETWTAESYRLTAAPLTEALDAGDQIDLGDRRFRVLHLPGHSPGCVGFFDETTGLLFSGDALYDGELLDDLPHSHVADYAETMARLLELRIRIGHGGHGPSFDEARKRDLIQDYLAGKRIQGCPGEALST
jgi:glyoxylase-like metal-dependent hydrolase (beta-lactamase superfamily II)